MIRNYGWTVALAGTYIGEENIQSPFLADSLVAKVRNYCLVGGISLLCGNLIDEPVEFLSTR